MTNESNARLREKVQAVLDAADVISGYEIQKNAGVPQGTISKLRSGDRTVDRLALETAERLADYYDKTLGDR